MKLEVSTDDLRKCSIFVGTPMYGGNAHGLYTKSCTDLATLCASYGIDVKFIFFSMKVQFSVLVTTWLTNFYVLNALT